MKMNLPNDLLFETETFARRSKAYNGLGNFDKCECCGHEFTMKDCICISYYDRYKQVLCDRCVDNKDGLTVWSGELSKERGLPPYRALEILKEIEGE
jgi:hypothetical protein